MSNWKIQENKKVETIDKTLTDNGDNTWNFGGDVFTTTEIQKILEPYQEIEDDSAQLRASQNFSELFPRSPLELPGK